MRYQFFFYMSLALFLVCVSTHAIADSSAPSAESTTKTITDIEIQGLTRTKKKVVLRELLFKIGDKYSLSALTQSVQRLRNLRIFASVDWQTQDIDDQRIRIILKLQERWTLIPIVKFTEGGDTKYYVLGVYNVNSFGRYFESGAQFESWNNQPGGVLWFREPRFMGHRLLLGGDLWSVKRPRPLYQADGREQGSYVSLRKRANLFLDKELKQGLVLGLGLEIIEDRIIASEEEPLLNTDIKSHLDGFKPNRNFLLSFRSSLGKIDHENELQSGKAVEVYAANANRSLYSDDTFYKVDIDGKAFWRIKKRDNLALRLKFGATNSEKLPNYYFLGGFENVRGYLDGQIRARKFWQSNFEYRRSFTNRSWYYLQGLVFADAMQAVRPDTSLEQRNNDIFSSLGIGMRIGSPKIYRFNLRMDLALVTSHPATSRFSVGVQQFF